MDQRRLRMIQTAMSTVNLLQLVPHNSLLRDTKRHGLPHLRAIDQDSAHEHERFDNAPWAASNVGRVTHGSLRSQHIGVRAVRRSEGVDL